MADFANARLDQLLMITLVAPRELGLYVVAANIGSFAWIDHRRHLAAAAGAHLREARSGWRRGLCGRSSRCLALLTLVVAALTPLVLEVLFGPEFTDAAEPAWVLLAAGLPFAGGEILKQTLNGVGRPGLTAIGQAAALAVTVPGLLLLIPEMGIVGAALVSLVAYTVNFLILLVSTMRTCDMSAIRAAGTDASRRGLAAGPGHLQAPFPRKTSD